MYMSGVVVLRGMCQKRPTIVSKETYYIVSKETYYIVSKETYYRCRSIERHASSGMCRRIEQHVSIHLFCLYSRSLLPLQ